MSKVTIFTPVYNRAYIIENLFKSLLEQSCKDFEWIIVDDGSSDNITEVVSEFQNQADFPIRFISQPNSGKHIAINNGLTKAQGEWFFIVDSDDSITPDAIEWIITEGASILPLPEFAGISGICKFPDGSKIGGETNFDIIDASCLEIRTKYKVKGDLAEIFKTDILRKYPFPAISGERFCPEALVWNRIARHHKLRYINHGIYVADYLPDGLTAKIVRIRHESHTASTIFYAELYHSLSSFSEKIKAAINFWRFEKVYHSYYAMKTPLSILCRPIGKLMRKRDFRKLQ